MNRRNRRCCQIFIAHLLNKIESEHNAQQTCCRPQNATDAQMSNRTVAVTWLNEILEAVQGGMATETARRTSQGARKCGGLRATAKLLVERTEHFGMIENREKVQKSWLNQQLDSSQVDGSSYNATNY